MIALLAAIALWAAPARAGACCVGATGTIPARLGECERWIAGVGLEGGTVVGRWQADGALAPSSLRESAAEATFAAGWRWSRAGQVGLSLPLLLTRRAAGELADTGGGIGDLRVSATWDPLDEHVPAAGGLGWPVPVLSLGLRLPTGSDWSASTSPLQADVTGLPGVSVAGGLALERTLGRSPWGVGLDGEAPLGPSRSLGEASLGASASLGRYLGQRWSVSGALRHQRSLAQASQTTAGLRLVHGQRMRWRAWAGADLDLPLAGVGQGSLRALEVTAGAAVVR